MGNFSRSNIHLFSSVQNPHLAADDGVAVSEGVTSNNVYTRISYIAGGALLT